MIGRFAADSVTHGMDLIEPMQSWIAERLKEMHGCDDTK